LIPKTTADVPPVGMKVVVVPQYRKKALPFPSVPTTTPAELTPKAMAFVDPLMFRVLAFVDLRGSAVKLRKFPLLSMVKPTAWPELAMPGLSQNGLSSGVARGQFPS
jgi:hypothetical protein